ncbi:MAG TPA: sulfite exporter TauE/SafE family protein [Xanthobacteraceae bacterium]|nr:sulfite exporter TauE/SafE family protein [Xanthobacteraceae bacterium]
MSFDSATLWAAGAALVAGTTRGFTGFGGALIFMPLVAAAYGPAVAAPALLAIDTVLTLPILAPALRACLWREVLPLSLAAMLGVPAGVALLELANPLALRWGIALLAFALLALLVSGWRYSGRTHAAATLGVGLLAGVLGGAAQLSGPPVVAYWLGGGRPAALVRANLFAFFAVLTLASGLAYALRGLFTAEVGRLSLTIGPLYAIGLFAGAKGFRRTSDAAYRRVAYAVIALAALASLPLFDALTGR